MSSYAESHFADVDARDRELELSGAVRLINSFASVDGLVLMNPALEIRGFGVKIRSDADVGKVYDGPSFSKRGTKAKLVDISGFGTRHSSMLQYCRMDGQALGIVVSQDGYVRMIMRIGPHLTFWDDVKLLRYSADHERYTEAEHSGRQRRENKPLTTSRGYTDMPKTMEDLMGLKEPMRVDE